MILKDIQSDSKRFKAIQSDSEYSKNFSRFFIYFGNNEIVKINIGLSFSIRQISEKNAFKTT